MLIYALSASVLPAQMSLLKTTRDEVLASLMKRTEPVRFSA